MSKDLGKEPTNKIPSETQHLIDSKADEEGMLNLFDWRGYRTSIMQYGAVGDGVADDSAAFFRAISVADDNGGGIVYFPDGTYLIDGADATVTLANDVMLVGTDGATVEFSNGDYIRFTAATAKSTTLDATAARGDVTITVASSSGASVGDVIHIESDLTAVSTGGWEHNKSADISTIEAIPDGTTITLSTPLNFPYALPAETVTINIYSKTKFGIRNLRFVKNSGAYGIFARGFYSAIFENLVVENENRDLVCYFLCPEKMMAPLIRNCEFKGLDTGILLIGVREARINNIIAERCNHAVDASNFCDGVYVDGVTGLYCVGTISSHPSFNVHLNNIWAYDSGESNNRAIGCSVRNSYFYCLDSGSSYGKFSSIDFITALEAIPNEYDVVFDNVEWIKPNNTTDWAGLGAVFARTVTFRNCVSASLHTAVSSGAGLPDYVVVDNCDFTVGWFRTFYLHISNSRAMGDGTGYALKINLGATSPQMYVSGCVFEDYDNVIEGDLGYSRPRMFVNCTFDTIATTFADLDVAQDFMYHFIGCRFVDVVAFDSYLLSDNLVSRGCIAEGTTPTTILIRHQDLDSVAKYTAGTFGSPVDVTATRKYGAEFHYSGNDYDVTGLRSRGSLQTTDASTRTAQGAELQAANADGIDAGVLNGAIIEAIGKSDTTAATIDMMRGILANTEWNEKDTITDLIVHHVRTHTRNAATEGYISGSSYMIKIENEAVGGNGQMINTGIYFLGTNLSAGNKAFDYGIDFSGAEIQTAELKFQNGETIDNLVNGILNLTAAANIGDGGNTDYMEVKADGEINLHGTARVKHHIKLFASAGRKAGIQDPTSAIVGEFAVEQFSQAVTENLYFDFQTPEDWDVTTDIIIHVHWAPVDGNAGDVVWDIDYTALASNANEVLTAAATSLTVTDSAELLQDEILESANMTMIAANIALEDTIALHLSRDTGNGNDTYGDAASFIYLEMEYTMNRLGESM